MPEVGREEVREVFERPYRIIYEVTAEAIIVLAVIEGHRLLRSEGGKREE